MPTKLRIRPLAVLSNVVIETWERNDREAVVAVHML